MNNEEKIISYVKKINRILDKMYEENEIFYTPELYGYLYNLEFDLMRAVKMKGDEKWK